jgi:hypothetical protein
MCVIDVSLFCLANFTNAIFMILWFDQDDEYEPAPGAVTKFTDYNESLLWTHGNFVARRKRSGCLSFLPAPRTLFFFELRDSKGDGLGEVTTCTPIGLYLLATSLMHPYLSVVMACICICFCWKILFSFVIAKSYGLQIK